MKCGGYSSPSRKTEDYGEYIDHVYPKIRRFLNSCVFLRHIKKIYVCIGGVLLINPIFQLSHINQCYYYNERVIVSTEQFSEATQLEMRRSIRRISHYVSSRFHYRITRCEVIILFFINLLANSCFPKKSSEVRTPFFFARAVFLSSSAFLFLFFFLLLTLVARYSSRNAAAALDILARHSLEPFSTL